MIVGGDSAGGGLALALAMPLRDAGEPGPASLLLLSPLLGWSVTLAGRLWDPRSEPLEDFLGDHPDLEREDIRACLAFAADREFRSLTLR